jgi:hypothetical protein
VDGHARTTRPAPANPQVQPPATRSNPAPVGAIRHPNVQDLASREIEGAILVAARGTDPESPAAVDPLSIEPDMMWALGGDGSDAAGAAPSIGWAQGGAPISVASPVNPAARVSGLDGRTGAAPSVSAAATPPPGSMALLVSLEIPVPATAGDGAAPDLQGDALIPSSKEPAPVDREASGPVWADPLDGPLGADWAAVDAELRQFLSRLGGLADATSALEAGAAWRLWIAAAMILVLARRGSSGPWRLLRPTATGAARDSARRPVPIGPWPLGPL